MTDRRTDGRTDGQTDGRTDARGKTICLPTLSGGDIIHHSKKEAKFNSDKSNGREKQNTEHISSFDIYFKGILLHSDSTNC